MKLFISYSHKDELFKDQLETQLSILKRNKTVSAWHDRKIMAGNEWKNDIDSNLEESEIILLLISPDFLDSDYCYEKEMLRAVEMHDSKKAIVVPIILRPCDWHETPFSKLQALPKNAEAISKWGDVDDAWLDVVLGLKKSINSANEKIDQELQITHEPIGTNDLTDDFILWLSDTEVELAHRKVSKVLLEDVFVVPDLKVLDEDMDHYTTSVSACDLVDGVTDALIFGDEQSGKTSLSKYYFKELRKKGHFPVYIQGDDIKSADFTKLVSNAFDEQYSSDFELLDLNNKILIIDNFSNNKLNKKHQNKFINGVKNEFEQVVIFVIDSFQYVSPEIEELDDFSCFEILSFGNIKRTELIEKWVSIGCAEEIDEQEMYTAVDEIKIKVEGLARGNILPPKPIYLLTLLQMFESITPQKVELTSYGHCYQYLIYQALQKAKIKNSEVEIYINFLTEFGCAQFNNNGIGLSESQLEIFHQEYEQKYLNINMVRIVNDLVDSGILFVRNDLLLFKYSYIYYFFTAKKFAESFSNDESVKKSIQTLLENLHREDCSNIIIFITHHSKDNWVLDEIQICLMELFADSEEAKLESKSLEFMTDFIDEIPDLILEHKKVEEERKKHDETAQVIEENNKELAEENDKLEPTDILAQINRTFKGIEIIGQIIRNRHGSLSKEKLEQLAQQAYGVGLRFLQYFLNISDNSKEEVVKSIEHLLKENPNIDNDKLEKEAKNIFLLLTYGAIFGVLRKLSMAVGSKEAEQIYKNIEKKTPTPAVKLINQAIYLQFHKSMDSGALRALSEEFNKNPTCERILKEIVIQHIYMFPVDYKQKQQIAEILHIPVAAQISLGSKKSLKV